MLDFNSYIDYSNSANHKAFDCLDLYGSCEGFKTWNEWKIDWLEKHIIRAKDAYYNSDNPWCDDQVYDRMENHLKVLKPDSPVLTMVGSKCKSQT